ncbi:MAG TPA: hypothetical protein VMF89_35765, partial [Polyangiales bacterium]|nr:hypothetical protein [Polyangiales bacterium]
MALCLGAAACSGEDGADGEGESSPAADAGAEQQGSLAPSLKQLEQRAYIVSRDSEELTVIDIERLEVVGKVPTGGGENHM